MSDLYFSGKFCCNRNRSYRLCVPVPAPTSLWLAIFASCAKSRTINEFLLWNLLLFFGLSRVNDPLDSSSLLWNSKPTLFLDLKICVEREARLDESEVVDDTEEIVVSNEAVDSDNITSSRDSSFIKFFRELLRFLSNSSSAGSKSGVVEKQGTRVPGNFVSEDGNERKG